MCWNRLLSGCQFLWCVVPFAYKAIPNNPKQVRKILISEYMIINSASSVVLLLRCMNSL